MDFFPPLRPPLRLADLPALEILAARDLDMPFRLRASYCFLFLIELPAMQVPSLGETLTLPALAAASHRENRP